MNRRATRGGNVLSLALLIMLLAQSAFVSAQAARTSLTLADMHRLEAVGEPDFSPDGDRIAYSVSTDDTVHDSGVSDLWVVDWASGPPRQLTATPLISESTPNFSRDSRWLAFLSDASINGDEDKADGDDDDGSATGDTQLWVMPAASGESRQVTNLSGGVTEYSLSPDGKRAVVVAETGSNVGKDAKTPPPIVINRYFFKSDGRGYLTDQVRHLFIVELATGKASQLTSGQRDHWHPVWSPDGKWIAYTAKDQGEGDRRLDYNVFVLAPEGGEPRRISTLDGADDDPDWEGRPDWSPDSTRLLWLEGNEDKWIYYGSPQLAVADLKSGVVTRPARIDRWFYKPRWSHDGKTILSLIEQDRDTYLARIEPRSGKVTYLTAGSRFGYEFAVGNGGRIALLESDPSTPYALRGIGRGGRALTNHNAWLAARQVGELKDISFKSGDVAIHGYMVLPPDYQPGRRYPAIFDLHGGPVWQFSHEFDMDQQLLAAAGYVVVAINPRGSSGRGFDFARAIYADWGNLDVKDISAGIDYAIAAGVVDPERIGVGGWSYGGILTDYMIASDARIKAAISGAGLGNPLGTYGVDMYAREYELELGPPWKTPETWIKLGYPLFKADRIHAATMFQCAGQDDNVPCAGAQQMYQALVTLGIPTTLVIYPGENHGLSVPSYLEDRMRRNVEWYDRWLKK